MEIATLLLLEGYTEGLAVQFAAFCRLANNRAKARDEQDVDVRSCMASPLLVINTGFAAAEPAGVNVLTT
jgi:hypothetical protein